ncbi:hypothetical protein CAUPRSCDRAFT_12891 [Caulochytrium protostelioides]|uniref:Uncharacterized protein n=1 Tax=Caulochytrium protostelioides TaxID=1555241 RepID=A0A4P9WT81_9FUNG|nr:hypothetical protein CAUPRSCDRAFT_12891 [Caulochytrium protostelioides]
MAWRAVTRAGQPAVRQALAATWAPAVLRLGPDRIGLGRSTLAVHAGRWLFAAGGARLFSRGPPADIALADVSPEWRAFVAQPFTFDQIPKGRRGVIGCSG